ncbi:MAG TPA: hypothetical protein PLX69_21160 [Leptospiraceae bacterium]|nr:hypothetical protein [Leptospiraceae bacterium]HRG77081.1 hypothetical protein [Leptospiraceae bacterium]
MNTEYTDTYPELGRRERYDTTLILVIWIESLSFFYRSFIGVIGGNLLGV